MAYQRRINPVQRSLSRPLTILGAERKLFFFAMCLGAATFNLFGSLMGGLLIFLLLYFVARWATATDPQILRLLIRAAIHEVARAGQVVIVAHAASMALAGAEGVLRVLVTASTEVRAKRLAMAEGLVVAAAEAAIAASDLERRDDLKRFYGVKEELPTHYDVVINTDVFTAEQAAAIVVATARVT